MSRHWRAALAISLTLLALGLLLSQILGSPLAMQAFEQLTWQAMLLPLACTFTSVLLSGTKWYALLCALEQKLPWTTAMRALLVAWPYAAVTPSRAGDLVRAWVIKDQVPLTMGGISVVVDRLLDIQSLLILATLGALYQQWWWAAAFLVSPIVAMWAGVFWAKKSAAPHTVAPAGRFARVWWESKRTVHQLAARPQGLAVAGALSLCTWLLVQSNFFFLNRAFSSPLTIPESFGLWPLATLLGLAPITLAGMGTRDVAFILLLALSRNKIDLQSLDSAGIQTLVQSSGHFMLATVTYTALSSWMFALIGLPWTIREWSSTQQRKAKAFDEATPAAKD